MDRAIRLLRRLSRPSPAPRTRGQMMVLFALAFTAMAAGVGMAADMAMWMVERQHLQTAVDSAAIAGARRLVAYAGDPGAVAQASAEAQNYLTQYGYPASAFTGSGQSLTMSSPGPRQFRIVATRSRPTLLVKLVGISQLSTSASSTATASIKADIYSANDVTASMSATDITNLKNALNSFIDMLGLDPSDPEGPRIAIGRFIGERCKRKPPLPNEDARAGRIGWVMGSSPDPRRNLSDNQYYSAFAHWQPTALGGWCYGVEGDPRVSAAPTLYSGGVWSPPPLSGPDYPPNPASGTYWNPFYPGALTLYQLGTSASAAHAAVNKVDGNVSPLVDNNCDPPAWSTLPPPNGPNPSSPLLPYRNCDYAGTSHVAGLVTGAVELNSNRTRYAQGQLTFRRVLILQTDGVVCNQAVPFNLAAARQRGIDVAAQLKSNPDPFQGIEIFVVMFWEPGGQTCQNLEVDDNEGTSFPNCPNATSLAAAGPMTANDRYLLDISSSKPGTCDHYLPFDKRNGSMLINAYREILKRLAVGKLIG